MEVRELCDLGVLLGGCLKSGRGSLVLGNGLLYTRKDADLSERRTTPLRLS